MAANDTVNKCISECKDTAGKLRQMANSESNTIIKKSLLEGAHHLDLCVTECQYSLQQTTM